MTKLQVDPVGKCHFILASQCLPHPHPLLAYELTRVWERVFTESQSLGFPWPPAGVLPPMEEGSAPPMEEGDVKHSGVRVVRDE